MKVGIIGAGTMGQGIAKPPARCALNNAMYMT